MMRSEGSIFQKCCAKMSKPSKSLEWDDMRFFLTVARVGTLSAASVQLKVDHTTVARRISRLEISLNTSLFLRKNSGYELTAAGEKLLGTAQTMEAAMLAAEVEVGDRNHSLAGVVRIGAPDGFGSYFIAPRLKEFCDANPALEIELVATARIFNLTKRESDIAISLAMPQQGRVVGRKLVDYALYLYGTEEYFLSAPPIRSTEDLGQHRFIGYIEDLLFSQELNYQPKISSSRVPQLRSTNLIAQLNAVLSGLGLAVLPAFIGQSIPNLVPVLPDRVKLMRTFYLHLNEDGHRISRIRETADYLIAVVAKNRSLFNPPM